MSEEAADQPKTKEEPQRQVEEKRSAGPGEADAQALLDAANQASERVAGVHLAFMALCAYVLAIVFSTTNLDLLIGKGIRLPVVNVEVPLVGFYAWAPYIVVLVHFNLLLQLQLLSRKLFAFEAAAPSEEGLGGLRDRLHIFPYTYYLVGSPSPLVRFLLGLMVSITLVLLPLLTLLVLQLWFLAYQSEAVTWCQRGAIWLDTVMIAILWPLILHSSDDWSAYWRELLAAQVPRRRAWLALPLLLAGSVLFLFSVSKLPVYVGLVLLLVSALAVMPLRDWQATPLPHKLSAVGLVVAAVLTKGIGLSSPLLFLLGPLLFIPLVVFWQPRAPRGSLALLLTLWLGLLLPPALQVDGGRLEGFVVFLQSGPAQLPGATLFSKKFLRDNRRLDLNEQVLLAKPPKPETLALIRSGKWQIGLRQIEPLNLQGRNLRHAGMSKVILLGADLRYAQLQGTNLWRAQLQGADLERAQLQGASLQEAHLQSASLGCAQLQGANLRWAELQGANLMGAELQGANLHWAKLQGADLERAWLQGADLAGVQLQGANLSWAWLQGADLGRAELQGANLWDAQLQGTNLGSAQLQGANLRDANIYFVDGPENTELIDARGVAWEPLPNYTLRDLIDDLTTWIKNKNRRQKVQDKLAVASRPGAPKLKLYSCLAQPHTPIVCEKWYDPENPEDLAAFKKELHAYLAELACTSPWIAQGLIKQITDPLLKPDSSRQGLEVVLKNLLDDKNCPGLQGLSQEWKDKLKDIK